MVSQNIRDGCDEAQVRWFLLLGVGTTQLITNEIGVQVLIQQPSMTSRTKSYSIHL